VCSTQGETCQLFSILLEKEWERAKVEEYIVFSH